MSTDMNIRLPPDQMPEAEVALRLAFYLLALPGSSKEARAAIDGAQTRVKDKRVFPLEAFLGSENWEPITTKKNTWQGTYAKGNLRLTLHAQSGVGDVVCRVGAKVVRAECKKGPLVRKPGNHEFPLIREALGQLLTIKEISPTDHLVVAVPRTERFRALANDWSDRPLIRHTQIHIVLVGRNGLVEGLRLP